MEKITITIPNGEKKEFNQNTSYYEISKAFNMSNNVLGVRINNEVFSLSDSANSDCKLEFIDLNDIVGHKIYASGLEFLFEVALKEVDKTLDITYQHSVPSGILGEIVGNKMLTQDDIVNIRNVMTRLINEDKLFKKLSVRNKDAIKYFEDINQKEKSENIQNVSDNVVSLYELNGIYNYFYSGMPYSTSSIQAFDIVYLGRNRLVFIIPNWRNKGKMPEYVHYDNIINSYLAGKNWLDRLNMKYATSVNNTIVNGNIKEFIKSCELLFNINISEVAKEITNNKNIKFVLIAGPSSSGKTTTCKRLSSYLRTEGYSPIKLSLDDFFKERLETPKKENGEYDFESPLAVDLELFNNTLKKLLFGESVSIPTFNFVSGKKEFTDNYVSLKDNSIILIEGLHALNDDLLKEIDNKYKYKIYLSPFIPLNIDRHNYISTTDLRLIRRIVRDNRTRGYDVNRTIKTWQSVRNGEEKYIFPYIQQADKIINTALPYEIGALKVYAEPLLRSIRVDSDYYEEARRLINFLKIFYTIPSEYVTEDSILREFIGGDSND